MAKIKTGSRDPHSTARMLPVTVRQVGIQGEVAMMIEHAMGELPDVRVVVIELNAADRRAS